MNRNNKLRCAFLLLGISLFFFSCKTSRPSESVALAKMGKEERIESIQYQSVQYKTLASSTRFSFKPGAKKSTTTANAQLRIIKDKIIQVSIRIPILGTEVARIDITPERVVFLNRNDKQYFSESMETLRLISAFDYDFYSLQALLSNQLFIAGKPDISKEDYPAFRWNEDDLFANLNHTDNQGIHYNFVSDYSNRIIKTEMYKNKGEFDVNWSYRDFGLTSNNRLFPMKMNMEVSLPDDVITLNLTFNNVDIDTDFGLNTSIPEKYQRIEIEQIIKLIQSF